MVRTDGGRLLAFTGGPLLLVSHNLVFDGQHPRNDDLKIPTRKTLMGHAGWAQCQFAARVLRGMRVIDT